MDPSGSELPFTISLSMLSRMLFFVIPEFVVVSLGIYWLSRRSNKKTIPVKASEEKIVALLIASGYLLWAIPAMFYSLTCSGKFCGMLIVIPAPEMMFFLSVDRAGFVGFSTLFIIINFFLIYIFSGIGAGNIIKKLLKQKK
jgi:hypothetical protein